MSATLPETLLYSSLYTSVCSKCSQLCVELVNSVQGSVQLQQQAIQRRLDDIFSRGLESAAADRELVSSIDNLRQQRFEVRIGMYTCNALVKWIIE